MIILQRHGACFVEHSKVMIRLYNIFSLFFVQSYLLNIPSWNPKCGDDVVCISEVQWT